VYRQPKMNGRRRAAVNVFEGTETITVPTRSQVIGQAAQSSSRTDTQNVETGDSVQRPAMLAFIDQGLDLQRTQ
jgi:hypothetical protein